MDFAGLSDKEVLDLWENEVAMERRDAILEELQSRRLFPNTHEYLYELETGVYPDSDIYRQRGQFFARDPEFLQKLMARREFAESIQHDWELPYDPCEEGRGFEVTPVQRFVANFMSPKTPYESALLYHGVGVGKTCAAVQIAENWLSMYPNRKVIIVAPPTIQGGFRTTLFDINRIEYGSKGIPNKAVQCTGSTYLELADALYLEKKDDELIQNRITKQINRRYDFFGYISFAKYIKDIIKPSQKIEDLVARAEDEKERINRAFDGRLLIIDEAHNLRELPQTDKALPDEDTDSPGGETDEADSKAGKTLTPYLDRVLKYSVGMKLVLMTATPMYNSYREIIFLMNLLLKNDGQAELREYDIFNADGDFKEGGEETLGLVASRYVSFMRGENPQSFPLRLYPLERDIPERYPHKNPRGGKVDMDETIYMEKLPIVTTELSGDSLRAVRYFSEKLTPGQSGISSFELQKIVQAGNLVVPLPPDIEDDDDSLESRIDVAALNLHFQRKVENKEVVYEPRSSASSRWLGLDQLGDYSPKFAKVISYIQKAEGVCFLYTRFVAAGAIPLALALEANGYTPYNRRSGLLVGGPVTPGGRQCALCENREEEHPSSSDHDFTPARYILLTGDAGISPKNIEMIKAEKIPDNVNGSRIKIVIGSQVAAEGVDLKYIREMHVLDSWYHLNKTEQIIGRGIRFRSHCALPAEKRNTTIFLHAATRPQSDRRESGDLYSYRVAFRKGRQVGQVSRVLKEYALDCNLNHDAIIIANTDPLSVVIDSQRNERNDVSMDDMPFTAVCDWMEDCDYKCAVPVDVDPLQTHDISYDEYAGRWREGKLKEKLRKLFSIQPFYTMKALSVEAFADIPKVALADLLYKLIGNKSFTVNYNGRDGYIIYKNGYYLFQPLKFIDVDIPIALRIASYPTKVETYEPRDIYSEVLERIRVKREAAVRMAEEGDEEGAAAAAEAADETAAAADAEDAEFMASAAPEKDAERTIEELIELWNAYDEWFARLTSHNELRKINAQIYPKTIGAYLIERAQGQRREEERLQERYQVIQWFAGACLPWNEEKASAFRSAMLQLVWDEEFSDEDHHTFLFADEALPESLNRAMKSQHYFTAKGQEIKRYINADTNAMRFFFDDEREVNEAQIKLWSPEREKNKAPKLTSDTVDPLVKTVITLSTTGPIYGFNTTEKGIYVFKSGRPSKKADDKLGVGEKCETTNIRGHREKVVEFGAYLESGGYGNHSLTEEILDKSTRKIVNSRRMCMLMDLVARYMDNLGVNGLRWFYRPVEARKGGHLGKR